MSSLYKEANMPFPTYVHSAIAIGTESAWPVQGQGVNECGCTVAANALNLLAGTKQFDKDELVRAAGLFFQRSMGGSLSPVTGWLLKRHGRGTHFGNLSHTDAETVLRDLIDRQVPVVVEIGSNYVGPFVIYGQHSILLVGYSDPHPDRSGVQHEDYYFVDSQWPALGAFDLGSNNTDCDGVAMPFPGNRTIPREEFKRLFQTGIYYPVFRSQAEHDAWYQANIRPEGGIPLLGWINNILIAGTYDRWVGPRSAVAARPA
jgi:hypothetical protein